MFRRTHKTSMSGGESAGVRRQEGFFAGKTPNTRRETRERKKKKRKKKRSFVVRGIKLLGGLSLRSAHRLHVKERRTPANSRATRVRSRPRPFTGAGPWLDDDARVTSQAAMWCACNDAAEGTETETAARVQKRRSSGEGSMKNYPTYRRRSWNS